MYIITQLVPDSVGVFYNLGNIFGVIMKRTKFTQDWLNALRSGEFKQTRETLRDTDGYCCIGVAAHLIGKLEGHTSTESYISASEAIGLSDEEMWHCIHMNDGLGGENPKTFPEIADAIEAMIDE